MNSSEPHLRRALLIGRFQPPHYGHLHAIRHALALADEVIIAVGSAQYSHTVENPFTAAERIEMLLRMLDGEGIPRSKCLIIPVPDAPAHSQWVSVLESFCPKFDVALTNDPLSAVLLAEAGYRVEPIPLLRRNVLSGTEVRRRMARGEDWAELVPPSVAEYLKESGLVERVRKLTAPLVKSLRKKIVGK